MFNIGHSHDIACWWKLGRTNIGWKPGTCRSWREKGPQNIESFSQMIGWNLSFFFSFFFFKQKTKIYYTKAYSSIGYLIRDIWAPEVPPHFYALPQAHVPEHSYQQFLCTDKVSRDKQNVSKFSEIFPTNTHQTYKIIHHITNVNWVDYIFVKHKPDTFFYDSTCQFQDQKIKCNPITY